MATSVAPTTVRAPRAPTAVIVVLGAVVFIYAVLEAMRVPALPLIQQGVGASTASVVWVFTGMELAAAVSLPLISRLADIRDKKKLFMVVLASVVVGIFVSGVANSILVLAIGQILQGVGSGFVPLALGMLKEAGLGARAKSGTGLVIGMTALGFIGGLVLVGPVVATLSYHWIFWFPLCGMVLVGVLAVLVLPSTEVRADGRVDWAGAVVLGSALIAVLLGLTKAPSWGWTSPGFLALVAAGTLLLVAFVLLELRLEQPLVDLRIGGRALLVTCVVAFAVGWATITTYLTVPTIVTAPPTAGYGLGATTTTVGLLVVPFGVVAAATAPLTGLLERAVGAKVLMVLSCVPIAASSVIVMLGRHDAVLLAVASAVMGLGMGVGLTQAMNIVATSVPAERMASATGLAMIVRAVGNTLGAQIAGSMLAASIVAGTSLPTWSTLMVVLVFATVIGVLAMVISFALPRQITAARDR